MPFSLGSGLPPTAIPNLQSKASPRSRCSVPTAPSRPPRDRRRKIAAGRGKNGEKQSRRGARRGQRTAAPALKQSPDKRQMSPEEPPSVNHRRAGAARAPGAARCQHRGRPGSASPPDGVTPGGCSVTPLPLCGVCSFPGIVGGGRGDPWSLCPHPGWRCPPQLVPSRFGSPTLRGTSAVLGWGQRNWEKGKGTNRVCPAGPGHPGWVERGEWKGQTEQGQTDKGGWEG